MGAPTGVCKIHGDWDLAVQNAGDLEIPMVCPACTVLEMRELQKTIREDVKKLEALRALVHDVRKDVDALIAGIPSDS